MRSTKRRHTHTGQSWSLDLCMVMSASLFPFFCRRNVIVTESIGVCFMLLDFGTSRRLWKKRISLRVSKVVLRGPFTLDYSQDCIPKKSAPVVS